MTEEKFIKEFSYYPWDMNDLAEEAIKVNGKLGELAKAYQQAAEALETHLEEIGYEWG